MEGDTFSGLGNGTQVDSKVLQTFQKSFVQVQSILDQNRLLINEINQNHESRIPDNLSRNVGLIRELNNNIRRVVDLYSDLSHSLTRSMEASSEGDSSGVLKSDAKATHKKSACLSLGPAVCIDIDIRCNAQLQPLLIRRLPSFYETKPKAKESRSCVGRPSLISVDQLGYVACTSGLL
ncbi:protein ELF4-LIKE 4-like, partial [Chenopodium quinoa]|uniref:protein ELF4-LIKE 4-like n=1 Tax=Chenopodium quinoa TaxID=63459 RepID=UPI000B78E3A0